MFCEECGSRIPDGAARCPACGASTGAAYTAPVREKQASPAWEEREYLDYREPSPGSRTESGKSKGLSSAFCMAENEQVVRQYHCSNVRRPKADGYLIVTNKRVLFQAEAATSRISKEVVLDSVSGLDCYYGLNVNVGGIILAVFCIIACFFCFGAREAMVLPGLILLALGIVLLIFSLRKCFFLSIYSSKANGSPISIGGGPRTLVGNGALYTLASEPTADTDRMINELGALIQDLQTLGDHAISKWS